MLPSGGWDTDYPTVVLQSPRNDWKYPLVAKCKLFSTGVVWTLTWNSATSNFVLVDQDGVQQLSLHIENVDSCDLCFDQEDRPQICWKDSTGILTYFRFWDSGSSTYQIVSIQGNSPCCMVDNLRDNLPTDSDIFIFYLRDLIVYYRVQSELYATEHQVPSSADVVALLTCGMTEDNRMSLRIQQQDSVMIAVGHRVVAVGTDYVGYPWGVVP